jgi:4-deoxy-L-threo-5-hexosulose-uronate ketol-isomerase
VLEESFGWRRSPEWAVVKQLKVRNPRQRSAWHKLPGGAVDGTRREVKCSKAEVLAVSVATRYLPGPAGLARMNSAEVREAFLMPDLFVRGEFRMTVTDADRLAAGGVVATVPTALPSAQAFGTSYFTERRELGVFCIAGSGSVTVGGQRFGLDRLDCLYVGLGNPEVVFEPSEGEPPVFYLASCPAHKAFPVALMRFSEVKPIQLGDTDHANCRRLRRYIHPDGTSSCQLVMGLTEVGPGGVWNTMPPHTHSRRSEVYLYFDIPPDAVVFHILGEPTETRHVVVRDREAVASPPWSLHSGVGTAPYRFIWAMAGENMAFSDMDAADLAGLR